VEADSSIDDTDNQPVPGGVCRVAIEEPQGIDITEIDRGDADGESRLERHAPFQRTPVILFRKDIQSFDLISAAA
jgi:hypothetical protein